MCQVLVYLDIGLPWQEGAIVGGWLDSLGSIKLQIIWILLRMTVLSSHKCGYCGLTGASTYDHIPPKLLFQGLKGVQLITIKACPRCHNPGTSLDDEYFGHFLLKYHRISDLPQAQPQINSMLRAAAKPEKRKYLENTVRNFVEVKASTFAGVSLGPQPAFRIDRKRLIRTSERYIRGLYRHEFGKIVSPSLKIRIVLNPEGIWQAKEEILRIFPEKNMKIVHADVFRYSYAVPIDNPNACCWFLLFFNQFPLIGHIH